MTRATEGKPRPRAPRGRRCGVGRPGVWLMMLCWMAAVQTCERAGASSPTSRPTTEAPTPFEHATRFRKGTWIGAAYGMFGVQPGGRRETYGSQTLGLGYVYADNFALNAEFTGLEATQDGPNVLAGGGDLLLRNHMIRGKGWSLFSDVGLGLMEANHRLPEGGTHFNFTTQAGLGLTFQLSERVDLLSGVRYFHLSNARMQGPARNPSINAIEEYVGLIYHF